MPTYPTAGANVARCNFEIVPGYPGTRTFIWELPLTPPAVPAINIDKSTLYGTVDGQTVTFAYPVEMDLLIGREWTLVDDTTDEPILRGAVVRWAGGAYPATPSEVRIAPGPGESVVVRATTGPQGPAGEITSVTATTLAPGSSATVTVGGTPEQRTIELGIPRGDVGPTTPSAGSVTPTAFAPSAIDPVMYMPGARTLGITGDGPAAPAWGMAIAFRSSLLFRAFDPTDAGSGPVALWTADAYFPGVSGGPGRYPNLAGTGAGLDLLEPATAAARPRRIVYYGTKSVLVPDGTNSIGTTHTSDLDVGDLDVRVELDVRSDAFTGNVRTLMAIYGTTSNQRSWQFRLAAGSNVPQLVLSATGSSTISTVSSGVTMPDGHYWLRVTRRASDGQVRFWASANGVAWNQLGADQTSPAGPLFVSTASLGLGARISTTSEQLNGHLYAAELRDGIDGPVVARWSAAEMGHLPTVIGGRSWNLGRSPTIKTAVIDRTIALLDGLDDYLEVPDDKRLDAGVGQALTVVCWYRSWAAPTTATIMAKKAATGSAGTGAGWLLRTGTGSGVLFALSTSDNVDGAVVSSGAGELPDGLKVVVARFTPGTAWAAVQGLRFASQTSTATDLTTTAPFRIGANGDGAAFHPMEWLGAAVFRRAVPDSEVETITNELLGRPDVQAERVEIDPVASAPLSNGFTTVTAGSAALGGGWRSSSVDGHWVDFPIDLSAGTWRIEVTYSRNSDGGIARISLDGTSIGTFDGYTASAVFNTSSTLTTTVARPGRKVLRVAIDGRNASSSSWTVRLQKIALTRIA